MVHKLNSLIQVSVVVHSELMYLAEPAVFPPLAVHSKLHLPRPPVNSTEQGHRLVYKHPLVCLYVLM